MFGFWRRIKQKLQNRTASQSRPNRGRSSGTADSSYDAGDWWNISSGDSGGDSGGGDSGGGGDCGGGGRSD